MKKIFVILLTLSYCISSTGMTLHIHYCCGKIDKVNFVQAKEQRCRMCRKKAMKKCCDDRQVSLKIQSDQKAEFAVKVLTKIFQQDKIYASNKITEELLADNHLTGFADNSPPLTKTIPIHILLCIYRI
ncbi:MAG: hypothetical protein ACHQEB_04785 [Chitinophagales bacterium]